MQDQREPTPEAVFARRMRELRDTEGIAQTTLAARLELHGIKLDGTAITRIERGTRAIRLNEAAAIAAALDVNLDAMLHPAPSVEEQLEQARRHEQNMFAHHALTNGEWAAATARRQRLEQEVARGE